MCGPYVWCLKICCIDPITDTAVAAKIFYKKIGGCSKEICFQIKSFLFQTNDKITHNDKIQTVKT